MLCIVDPRLGNHNRLRYGVFIEGFRDPRANCASSVEKGKSEIFVWSVSRTVAHFPCLVGLVSFTETEASKIGFMVVVILENAFKPC